MFQNNVVSFAQQASQLRSKETASPFQGSSYVRMNMPSELEFNQQKDRSERYFNIENPSEILNKFAAFIKFHAVKAFDIWERRSKLPIFDFVDEVQKKLGYKFNMQEVRCLRQISSDGQLSIQIFNHLGIWVHQNSLKSTLLSTMSQNYFARTNKERHSATKLMIKRPTEFKRNSIQRQLTNRSNKLNNSTQLKTTYDNITKTFLRSGFTNVQNRDAKEMKIESLREDLEMNALEKKWEFIVMAGEMNKWIDEATRNTDKQKGFVSHFKIHNDRSAFVIIKTAENGQNQTIPEVVFIKKYNSMKKKQVIFKEVEPKLNMNDAVLGILELGKSKPENGKLSHRDRELNQALLHIMRVKNVLQYQHKILSQAAINT